MELKPKFDVTYMETAIVFLESLPDKVKDKIAYNISKSRYFMDKELFKKLNDDIGNFVPSFKVSHIVYWLSGTKIQAILS